MNTKNVSATNVRVNLTDIISGLDADNRVAITKHGKITAYLVAHVEEVIVEAEAGELACETTPSPNYEPDPDLDELLEVDEEDFDAFLVRLKEETLDNLEVAG